ncbi:hypothetical protein SAMN05421640_1968 [Ekhidna lutea]|uniref:Uncharacterized protein n=1 Tax=Ekhidna lutea TaxID=447679 RepID=A0A239J4C6_EKHLU|nr:hypothetical protein [Ekhidna lutea]SNT00328.1 hypothetical protein SAMN05421640_1968 [Ekhidna lutea]
MKKSVQHQFEYNVLLLACFLGLVRSALAVIEDLEDISLHPDFITDILFTILFIITLIGLRLNKSLTWLIFVFYLPLLSLFIYTFYSARGIQGSIEHNIFVGLIFINFTLRKKLPIYFSLAYVFAVVLSLILLEIEYNLSTNYSNAHSGYLNFVFAMVGIMGLTYYAKYVFVSRRQRLHQNSEELKAKRDELKIKQDQLITQKSELEQLAIQLDQKATQQTQAVNDQKKRRKEYMALTTTELTKKYQVAVQLIEEIESSSENDKLMDMLHQSGIRLKNEIRELKHKVNADN